MELENKKISDMVRETGDNYAGFMLHVANHIDKLESHILKLEQRILELEETYENRESQ